MRVRVTDHALVRYMQRVLGVDVEMHRRTLAELAQPFVDLRVKHAKIGVACLVFENETLVTVVDDMPSPKSSLINDRGRKNGTDMRSEKPHWKHLRRLNK